MSDLTPTIRGATPTHVVSHHQTLAQSLGTLAVPILLGVTLLASFALRLYCLDCHGFWGDEINSLDGAAVGFPDMVTGRFGWIANQTPLHYLILWLTTLPFDPRESAFLVRLPQALAGALTPAVVYLLGKETLGKAQGLMAAALMAFSAVHLNYSQELRLYALMVFLSTLSLYTLVKAERTGHAGWWAAFVAVSSLNVLNAYVVLTLFIPTIMLYLTWLLWKLWRVRLAGGMERAHFRYATIAVLALAAVCAFSYLDMAAVPRPAPQPLTLSPLAPITSTIELMTWMTSFALDAQWERSAQLLLLLAALGGAAAAFRQKEKSRHAALLLLILVVPATLLAVFSTTNVVFQRYAIFAMPAYFLLAANGIFAPLALAARATSTTPRMLLRAASVGMTTLALTVSLWSALVYHSPGGHEQLTYRPDFRGAAQYLATRATPQDLIVFMDDPGLGYTITGYYLKERFPAPAYDARDPRLYSHLSPESIYWVISAENLSTLEGLASMAGDFEEVTHFTRVIVLRETRPTGGTLGAAKRMVEQLDTLQFGYQPVQTLRGTLLQAEGDIAGAALAYGAAGAYFPVGDDYLRTAVEYEARGETYKAWREAALSKFWEPGKPAVHLFMAHKLEVDSHAAESRIEAQIAEMLKLGNTPR